MMILLIFRIMYQRNIRKWSLHDRAAQFAPFAALTGYDEEVKEVSRITDQFHPLES